MKYKVGDMFPLKELKSVTGQDVKIPNAEKMIHLQFRRFVDCPICNTHIAELLRHASQIKSAGVDEVIVFHSSVNSIRAHQKNIPFIFVADPKKQLYKEFGLESSLGFLSLKAAGAALRGAIHGHLGLRMLDGPLGLPADFLIAPSGRIIAVKYGTHAYDQWSASELLLHAQ